MLPSLFLMFLVQREEGGEMILEGHTEEDGLLIPF